jgi:hypothetical protein
MSNVPNYRLPVKREPSPPPALWRQAAPVVARGAALVAVGVIAEWLLRSATRRAMSLPANGNGKKKSRAVAKAAPAIRSAVVQYSETIIVQRTVTRSGE